MNEDEKLWTSNELMKFLNISQTKFDKLLKDGLPYFRLGSMYRFSKSQVCDWLKTKNVNAMGGDNDKAGLLPGNDEELQQTC